MILQWKDPPTTEGKARLAEFNQSFAMWINSGFMDNSSLEKASANLSNLFDRSPDYAAQIQQIALHISFLAHTKTDSVRASTVISIILLGLKAGNLIRYNELLPSNKTGLLQLFLAEAYLKDGRRFEALDTLRFLEAEVAKLKASDLLTKYMNSFRKLLIASSYEMGLEFQRSAYAFAESHGGVSTILEDERKFNNFAESLLNEIFGIDESSEYNDRGEKISKFNEELSNIDPLVWEQLQSTNKDFGAQFNIGLDPTSLSDFKAPLIPLVERELSSIHIKGLLGFLRVNPNKKNATSLNKVIDTLFKAINKYGLPVMNQIDLAETIAYLGSKTDPQKSHALANLIFKLAMDASEDRESTETLFLSTHSRLYASYKDKEHVEQLHQKIYPLVKNCNSSTITAITYGNVLMDINDLTQDNLKIHANRFLQSVTKLRRHPILGLAPRVKAYLDEPVAITIEWAFNEWMKNRKPVQRAGLAVVLDLLRDPNWSIIPSEYPKNSNQEGTLGFEGLIASLDRLNRIHFALSDHPSTAVIILQSLRKRVLFICLTGNNNKPIITAFADDNYRENTRKLATDAREELDFVGISGGGAAGDGTLVLSGNKAFSALPSEVKNIMSNNNILLLIPDFRSDEDSVPFELMHDGNSYLGISKVVSRLISLSHATQLLEGSNFYSHFRRAVIAAAPNAPGLQVLNYANAEVRNIRQLLKSRSWDVPNILEERLSASFFIDRMEYISILHIAAHGVAAAGDYALILPHNEKLVVDDINRKKYLQLPFVYLDTCSLGETRYLGGGVNKGICFTLVATGAPAVVANLTPVVDKSAYDLSLEFYHNSENMGIGKALRDTRRNLTKKGMHPAYWGTTVMMGDPEYILPGSKPGYPKTSEKLKDPALRVLDAFMNIDYTEKNRKVTYRKAMDALANKPENSKLIASLNLINSVSQLTDLSDPVQMKELDIDILLAEELNHLPSRGMLYMLKTEQIMTGSNIESKIEALENVIPVLEQLAKIKNNWQPPLDRYLASLKRLKLANRGRGPRIIGSQSSSELTDDENAILDILYAYQASEEQKEGEITMKQTENSLDDVLWNAIVIAQPSHFEDMPETVSYCSQLTRKLIVREFLPTKSMPYAQTLLTGLIRFLWDTQNLSHLQREIVDGSAMTLKEAINDITKNWAPPDVNEWFKIVSNFPKEVDRTLVFLNSLTYDTIYHHLEKSMSNLEKVAGSLLEELQKKHPEAVDGCAAYVLGTLIEKNTFSPLDGSVPEDLERGLSKIYHNISQNAEGYFQSYLWKGFSKERNKEFDELDRWKLTSVKE